MHRRSDIQHRWCQPLEIVGVSLGFPDCFFRRQERENGSHQFFSGGRSPLFERRMPRKTSGKTRCLFNHGVSGLSVAWNGMTVTTRVLQRRKEALQTCGSVAGTQWTAADFDVHLCSPGQRVRCRGGVPLISVDQPLFGGRTTSQRHLQRAPDHCLRGARTHRPAHHHARKPIEDPSHIQPAFRAPDTGGVADPGGRGCHGSERALDPRGGCERPVSLPRPQRGGAPTCGCPIPLTHERSRWLTRATEASLAHLPMHAWTSRDATMGMEHAMQLCGPFAIFSLLGTGFTRTPVRGATDANQQHTAQGTHWRERGMLRDEGRVPRWAREKMASTFVGCHAPVG